jgi:glycosyltransferase involved in cell wall biosynthesis/uncharacterized membrane protein YbhN (UPF0104 family)
MNVAPGHHPDPPSRPLRVLNLIDGLSGGGSERVLCDTVRLTDSTQIRHFVSTASPEWLGNFEYAAELRAAGVYINRPPGKQILPVFALRLMAKLRDFMRGDPSEHKSGWRPPIRFFAQFGTLVISFPRAAFATVRTRPDVIHAHTFYSFVHATILGRMLRIPVIHTMPCLFVQMSDAGVSWLPHYYKWSRRMVSRYFTSYPKELLGIGVEAKRIVVLYSVLDISSVQLVRAQREAHRQDILRRLAIPPDSVLALAVGRLHTSKGQSKAISALSLLADRFPNLHLLILGDGLERVSLENQIRSLGLVNRVHLPGFISNLLPYYAAADIYLRTYLFEGDNLSSLQALAMGVPAVGFDTNRETDVLRDAQAGLLVPPGDERALAGALDEVLSLPDRGAALGAAGAAHLDSKFDVHRLIEALEKNYRELARPLPRYAPFKRFKAPLLWMAKLITTVAITSYVLTRVVNWPSIAHAAASFPKTALAELALLVLLQRILLAWQTRIALAHAQVVLGTFRVFHIHLVTSFLSIVLPGDLAGAAVSWHMFSKDSGRRAATAATLVYLRLVGLSLLVLASAFGIFIEPRLLVSHAQILVLAAAVVVGLPTLSFLSPAIARSLERISLLVTSHISWLRLRSAFAGFWLSVHEFSTMHRRTQGAIWFAAVGSYALAVAGGLVAMRASHMQAPLISIVWLMPVITLASLVPFTLAGFGVRELGVVALMGRWYQVPVEQSVLFSLALGTVGVVVSVGFGGVAFLVEGIAIRRTPSISR